MFYSHNFGHNGPLEFHGLGINAKISELQAAMGLAVLPYLGKIIAERKMVVDYYDSQLKNSNLQRIKIRKGTDWNYSYYPVIFETEEKLIEAQRIMNENDILPRRYFYPSLNTIEYVNGGKMPVSESIAKRILCLPLYCGLKEVELNKIINLINRTNG